MTVAKKPAAPRNVASVDDVDDVTPPTSTTPKAGAARDAAVGSTVEFDTTDPITGHPLRGFGVVRGHLDTVDADGNDVTLAKVALLPAGVLLIGDGELLPDGG